MSAASVAAVSLLITTGGRPREHCFACQPVGTRQIAAVRLAESSQQGLEPPASFLKVS